MKFRLLAVAAIGMLGLSLSPAWADDDLTKHMINNPSVDAWGAYGAQTTRKIPDKTVQGGQAFEVTVTAAGAQPWETAAVTPITGKIARGDKLIAAVWLRTESPTAAPAKVILDLQLAAAPYTFLAQKDLTITGAWKLYSLDTVAESDFAANTANLVVQLAGAKQVVVLGPSFVVDLGPAKPAS